MFNSDIPSLAVRGNLWGNDVTGPLEDNTYVNMHIYSKTNHSLRGFIRKDINSVSKTPVSHLGEKP